MSLKQMAASLQCLTKQKLLLTQRLMDSDWRTTFTGGGTNPCFFYLRRVHHNTSHQGQPSQGETRNSHWLCPTTARGLRQVVFLPLERGRNLELLSEMSHVRHEGGWEHRKIVSQFEGKYSDRTQGFRHGSACGRMEAHLTSLKPSSQRCKQAR